MPDDQPHGLPRSPLFLRVTNGNRNDRHNHFQEAEVAKKGDLHHAKLCYIGVPMTIVVLPLWVIGLVFCWLPLKIARRNDPGAWAWPWIAFGIVCLPLAILFAFFEKPAAQRGL